MLKALPSGGAFCPNCGKPLTSPHTSGLELQRANNDRRNGIISAGVIGLLAIMWFCGTLEEKREEPKKKAAIEVVQHFCAPGYDLRTLMDNQSWKDDGTWFVNPWPYGTSEEMKNSGMTDNWLVEYEVTVMDGLQERKVKAQFAVDLNSNAHSALDAPAKNLFICF